MTNQKHTKKIIILFLLSIIAYCIRYTFNVFLAHHLNKSSYGDFSIAFKSFLLMSSLLLLGTNLGASRFLSNFLNLHLEKNIQDYIAWNVKFIIRLSKFFLIFLSLFVATLVLLHVFDIKNIYSYHLAIYMIFFSPIGAMFFLIASYLNCNNNLYLSIIFQSIAYYLLIFSMFFISTVYLSQVLTNTSMIIIVATAFFVLFLTELFVFSRKVPVPILKIIINKIVQSEENILWKKTSLRLVINQIILLLVATIDLFLVEFFAKNEAQVGEYAAILSICGILWLISSSVTSFLSPLVSSHFENNKPFLQKAINQAFISNMIINFFILVGILCFMKYLLFPFGSDYYTYSTKVTLLILSISILIGILSKPASLVLIFSGHEEGMLIILLIQLFVLIVVGSVMAFYFGMFGVAVATGISMCIKTVLVMIYLKQKTGYKPLVWI